MIRQLLAYVLLFIALSLGVSPQAAADARPPTTAATTAQMPTFHTEAAAQAYCPRDEVVWLNTSSGIYHEKGMRWYGQTKHGAYVCRREADAVGYRDTRNGQ